MFKVSHMHLPSPVVDKRSFLPHLSFSFYFVFNDLLFRSPIANSPNQGNMSVLAPDSDQDNEHNMIGEFHSSFIHLMQKEERALQ